jgi:post-segregation antitoxin (ccd killing protein)
MPRVNIWLPAELHRAVKAADIPVSEVAQRALAREVRIRRASRQLREHLDSRETTNIRRP